MLRGRRGRGGDRNRAQRTEQGCPGCRASTRALRSRVCALTTLLYGPYGDVNWRYKGMRLLVGEYYTL